MCIILFLWELYATFYLLALRHVLGYLVLLFMIQSRQNKNELQSLLLVKIYIIIKDISFKNLFSFLLKEMTFILLLCIEVMQVNWLTF